MEQTTTLTNEQITPMEDFDKTLTQEEKDAFGYLNWSNETLGRCVKSLAKKLYETDMKGFKGIKTMSAIYVLVQMAKSVNAGEIKQSIEGYTDGESKTPTAWEITVKQINPKKKKRTQQPLSI